VLPGLEVAFPPMEQKSTAIWRKLTAILNLSKIPLLCFSLKILPKLNSAIFPLLLVKIDSGTAIKMSPLVSLIFR
jgi:hypothetical protein